MLCSESFEGAEGNLKRMITLHSFTGKEEDPLQRCIARLLSLLQLWNCVVPNSDRINQVSQVSINKKNKDLYLKLKISTIT